MKYKVIFENARGKKRVIDTCEDEDSCYRTIARFLKEHDFTSYYQRRCKISDTTTWIDVGSHSEFFYIEEVSK